MEGNHFGVGLLVSVVCVVSTCKGLAWIETLYGVDVCPLQFVETTMRNIMSPTRE